MAPMQLRPIALFAAVALLGACKSAPPPVKATLVEVTADAVVLDVTTTPGTNVSKSYGDRGSPADASGHARLEIPRREWTGWWGDEVEVIAHGSRSATSEARVKLPVPLTSLVRIPQGKPGWLAYLGGDPLPTGSCKVEQQVTLEVDGSAAIVRGEGRDTWCPASTARKVAVSVPPGAHLDFARASLDAPTGIASIDLDVDTLTGAVALATLTTKKPAIDLAAKVRTKDGTTTESTVRLRAASWHDVPTWLAERLDRIAKGSPLAGSGTLSTVVVRGADGKLSSLGPEGSLRDVKWVALEEGTKRSVDSHGSNCVLHDWEDLDVTIVDAHTGAKLGARKFRAPDAPCEGWLNSHEAKSSVVPDEDVVQAWITSGTTTGTWK